MLTGENGILTQAQKAKTDTENATKNEVTILDEYNNTLNNYINGVSIPEGLEIGSTVSYNPNGTYDKFNENYSGSSENLVELDSSTDEFNIDTWRVFQIDEKTGKITLVPTSSTYSTNGFVYLQGAQGYNNAIYLLNEACSYLYGDSSKGIVARSINIEDIEGKMTKEALTNAHNFSNATKYGEQVTNEYIQGNSYYPSLYAKESLREINEIYNSSGLGISEQTNLIDSANDGATEGYLQGTSIKPTQTFWYGESSFMKTAFKTSDNGVNYYNLLIPNGTETCYWIASRSVDTYSGGICGFSIEDIGHGAMYANNVFNSNKEEIKQNSGLFPIISLKSELISGDASSGFIVE